MDNLPNPQQAGGPSMPVHTWSPPNTNACVMLALHGFTGSGEDFRPLAQALPELCWVAPDLPGHIPGGTPPLPDTVTLESCMSALDAIARNMLSAPVLLGYSMGGRLALSLALRHQPPPLSGVVLIGATPGIADASERSARRAADNDLADMIERRGIEAFLAHWQQQPAIGSQKRIVPPIKEPMQARRRIQNPHGLATALRSLGTGVMPPLWDSLSRLRCPVLLVTGAEDAKFSEISERMRRAIPHAEHRVIPDAGHAAHLEAPGAFVDVLRNWLHRQRLVTSA